MTEEAWKVPRGIIADRVDYRIPVQRPRPTTSIQALQRAALEETKQACAQQVDGQRTS